MTARVDYKASVEKDLRKLDRASALRLLERVERVLRSEGPKGEALAGDFAGLYRIRVGEYRVIYARTDEGYLVLRIAHRREAYARGRPGGV